MTSEESAWSAVLDAMQKRLDQAQIVLAGQDVSLDDFAVPTAPGSLPPALAGRARQLLEATIRMEHEIEHAMAGVAARAADVPFWRGDAARPSPSYIDRKA